MNRVQATLLTLGGATLMSFVGLLLRLIESADGFQILFYRSFSLAVMVMLVACLRRKTSPLRFFLSIDWWDILMGLFLGIAFSFYVYALLNTNIASALFILSSSPVFAAVLGWVFVGERPSRITFIALGLAVTGVGVMVYDGIETGGILGNLYALFSAFCFAAMLVMVRWLNRDSLGGTFVGGIVAMLMNEFVAIGIGSGIMISQWDLGLSLFMGAFTIGLGIACVTWAASYLPASEVSLLVLVESVLGPIWVWLFLNETTTVNVILGGGIVLCAVIMQTVGGNRKRISPVGIQPS